MSGSNATTGQGRVIRTVVPGNRSAEEIYEDEAHQIVDEAIENALHRIGTNVEIDKIDQNQPAEEEPVVDPETGFVIPNVKWMSAENFSVAGGLEKIEEFIKTWERDSSWLHCIDFLREEDHPYSYRYRYAVRWSIPTRRKPIPRATASVYFTMEVSKFKPKTFPVEVYFVVESHHLVHRPGKTRFREKWLKDVVQSKIKLMELVTF